LFFEIVIAGLLFDGIKCIKEYPRNAGKNKEEVT